MDPRGALAWFARHGNIVLAAGVFLGLMLPPLAALLRPLLVPAILAPFLIALLRLDWSRLLHYLGRPDEAATALLWLLLIAPVLVDLALRPLALPPAVHGALVLAAAAPPVMASGNLALLLRLDAALAVLVTMLATALMPITLPSVALYLLGVEIDLALGELMLRLGLLVGGCLGVAALLRWLLPPGYIERHAAPLDGIAILGLLLFAIAIMDGITAMLFEHPGFVLGCTATVYCLNVGQQTLGALVFAWRGCSSALTLGLCSGNRNVGLLLAAVADRASPEFLIIVAVAQLPIYTLPALQGRLYRRWLTRERPLDRTMAC